MSAQAQVAIRAIAGGGDGVGTLADGRTVFVPRTAPGDMVTLRQVRLHARYARGMIDRIVVPGAARVEPPCPHYRRDHCGGCQLMHLDMPAQRAAKQRIVGDALRRIAGLDVEDPPVVAAPHALGYRAKVSFTVRGSTIGFHRQGEPGRVFEVRRCLLLEPGLEVLHQRLRAARRFLPALTERVVIRRDADGGRHVVIHTTGGAPWQGVPSLAAALGEGVVVWWHPQDGAARAVAGSDDPWPVTVFEQVHPVMAARVRHEAVERLLEPLPGSGTPGLVWDLYAGIGETSALLAHRGVAVESVELDSRAVALAERRGPAGPRRLSGDVAECLQRLSPPWRVIVNPPRAGLAEPVSAALAAAAVERIVYVSCDPGTLARDLRRLAPSHHLTAVVAFDQFPQTAHVECLATLERR